MPGFTSSANIRITIFNIGIIYTGYYTGTVDFKLQQVFGIGLNVSIFIGYFNGNKRQVLSVSSQYFVRSAISFIFAALPDVCKMVDSTSLLSNTPTAFNSPAA